MIKFGEVVIPLLAKDYIEDCLKRNHVTMGEKTKLLEEMWSKHFGHKHTVAVSSGTAACIAACLTLYDFGAKPGDEIIVPALSFIATANAVRAAGFKPVFVDVKPDTLGIDVSLIEEKITKSTVAIMPVALMGKPPEINAIRKICDQNGLMVLVDNCEGHGCKVDDKYMEDYADIVVYSCYAAHILFAGEMGLVCTNKDDIKDILVSVRSHGRKPNSLYFDHARYGLNLKPTDLHASIGLGNMPSFKDIFDKRKLNWQYFTDEFEDLDEHCWFIKENDNEVVSPHAFSLTFKRPNQIDLFKKWLSLNEIEWKRNFGCMATHKCFEYLGHTANDFPNAEWVGNNGVHWGVHQHLCLADKDKIVNVVRMFFNEN